MVLSGYEKCLSIPIGSSDDGQLTNYQIKLTLVKGSGTNSGNTIYLNNENLNWPNDVRFSTDEDGNTLIDFWREEYDATDGTWWVEVPTIPASGGTTIYLHVGDADAPDASDASATFVFFDGAEYSDSPTNHGWTYSTSSTPDIATSTDMAYTGSRSFKNAKVTSALKRAFADLTNVAIRATVYDDGVTSNKTLLLLAMGSVWTLVAIDTSTSTSKYCYRKSSGNMTAGSISRSNGWRVFEHRILSSQKIYIDDSLLIENTDVSSLSELHFGCWWTGGSSVFTYTDNILVRNIAADEPVISAASWVGYTLFGGTWGMIS